MKHSAALTALAAAGIVLSIPSVAHASGAPGAFQTTLSGNSDRTEQGQLDGTWTIDLASPTSGPLNLTRDGQPLGGGTYAISGSTITLTPKAGGACTTDGVYDFKWNGTTIKFEPISDSCATRRDVVTFTPWKATG